MARYLSRTCPKCKEYLGIVVPESKRQEIPVKGTCLDCGFRLSWRVVTGKKAGRSPVTRALALVVTLFLFLSSLVWGTVIDLYVSAPLGKLPWRELQ